MIVKKYINKIKTIVVECKKDILFSSTNVVNDTVMLGFSEFGEKQDLNKIIPKDAYSYDDYPPPKILLEFHHLKSIDNLIDQLKDCRKLLSDSKKGENK